MQQAACLQRLFYVQSCCSQPVSNAASCLPTETLFMFSPAASSLYLMLQAACLHRLFLSSVLLLTAYIQCRQLPPYRDSFYVQSSCFQPISSAASCLPTETLFMFSLAAASLYQCRKLPAYRDLLLTACIQCFQRPAYRDLFYVQSCCCQPVSSATSCLPTETLFMFSLAAASLYPVPQAAWIQ